MAWRCPNPVVSLRCGACVLLVAAGTLTALVISDWPRAGEMIARQAAASRANAQPGALVKGHKAPTPAFPLNLDLVTLMPDEPDLLRAKVPRLILSGSAAESRRDAQAAAQSIPPLRPLRGCGNSDLSEYVALDDYVEWAKTTPVGKVVEEVTSYDPTRTAATVQLLPQVSATAGKSGFGAGELAPIGKVVNADGTTARGEADLYDFTVRMDSGGTLPPTSAVGLGVAAGLRAASLYDPTARESYLTEPLPVIGGDASLKWSDNSMLRASAMGEAPGVIRDYLDLRLEQVWSLGGTSSFSVGWRHLRGIVSNELPEPTVRQDAILLELKLGF